MTLDDAEQFFYGNLKFFLNFFINQLKRELLKTNNLIIAKIINFPELDI